ncbi:hypothetical protein [Pedobacter alluvionis]|uniref:DUF2975 domain-containing protein n=1 Tax=Pedobacter alluvionis TaxID=475253 RepID=A0A497YIU3_9SPHI|nr:hypothetical protein [Pedobacter alluvionis]RLJ80150.1 hypothetical protein BCL90_0892 [Pedobacter alluvionis]TFB31435.1 hypothetical protein E3V97_12630 [Pedobacter alluvionis]
MNKLLRIFRYAGFSLIFIGLVSIANHLINAVDNYNAGQLSINLTENSVVQQVKTIGAAKFTNSHFGTYAFKPTLKQAIILSDKGLDGIGAYTAFYLIIGSVILFIAYTRPKWLENITENRLWQLVGIGGILFFALKFLFFFLMKGYVEDLTGKAFTYQTMDAGNINLGVISIIAIFSIIYELLSYSRKLKQENDLTI